MEGVILVMDNFNTYEYGAEQKNEGKWRIYRLLLISAYILFAVAYFLAIYISRIFPLGALIPVFLWILVHFTWRYVKPDYKYTVEAGYFTFTKIYASRIKKEVARFLISSAIEIAPSEAIRTSLNTVKKKNAHSAIPERNAENQYTAIYNNERGEVCAVNFVATKECLKLMRFYNSKTVVADNLR